MHSLNGLQVSGTALMHYVKVLSQNAITAMSFTLGMRIFSQLKKDRMVFISKLNSFFEGQN